MLEMGSLFIGLELLPGEMIHALITISSFNHYACVEYLTKYATKGETRSPTIEETLSKIMNNAQSNSDPHKAMKNNHENSW